MNIGAYFSRHAQVLVGSLGRIAEQPLAAFMTMAVIGVAIQHGWNPWLVLALIQIFSLSYAPMSLCRRRKNSRSRRSSRFDS